MPEPNGWTLVKEPTGWTPVKAEPVDASANVTMQDLASQGPSALRATKGQAFKETAKFAGEHPGAMGAAVASAAAAPWVAAAGLPVLGLMGVEGAIGALGAAGGHGTKAAVTGQIPSADEVGGDMLTQGLLGAGGAGLLRGVPAAVRLAKNPGKAAMTALDIAGHVPGIGGPARMVSGAIRLAKKFSSAAEAAPAVANTGAPIESEIASALQEARTAKPGTVSLPPQPTLPPGYKPRASAPAARIKAPPPTHAAAVAAPAPTRAVTPAVAPTQELPASWKKLVDAPTPAPKTAPLGLSDDAPLWSRGEPVGNPAKDMRGAMGAEDAGALMDMSADDVRALSGAPKRRPLVADLADLDLGYSRQLANPRGSVPAGVAAGMGAGAPMAELLRRALLKAMSGDEAP